MHAEVSGGGPPPLSSVVHLPIGPIGRCALRTLRSCGTADTSCSGGSGAIRKCAPKCKESEKSLRSSYTIYDRSAGQNAKTSLRIAASPSPKPASWSACGGRCRLRLDGSSSALQWSRIRCWGQEQAAAACRGRREQAPRRGCWKSWSGSRPSSGATTHPADAARPTLCSLRQPAHEIDRTLLKCQKRDILRPICTPLVEAGPKDFVRMFVNERVQQLAGGTAYESDDDRRSAASERPPVGVIGIVKVKRVSADVDVTAMLPPCARAISKAICRPRPSP